MLKKIICGLLVLCALCTFVSCETFGLKGLTIVDGDREFSLEEVKASSEK